MKKLDLSQSIGILANLGVIAGIVFLAFEIRQNNDLLAQQSRAVALSTYLSTLERFIENPQLIELRTANPNTLTDVERRQREFLGIRTLAAWEYQWREWRRGLMDDAALNLKTIHSAFHGLEEAGEGNYMADAWSIYKETRASPEFVEWMEENVVKER